MSVATKSYGSAIASPRSNNAGQAKPTVAHPVALVAHIDPLEKRVAQVLSRNPHLLGRGVQCCADCGRVRLHGSVGSYFQKQMAQEAVRRVDGVVEICNELRVCHGTKG